MPATPGVTGLAQAPELHRPHCKQLGPQAETTVAIIVKFADAGIDANRAGTALNAILSQFADHRQVSRGLAGAGITTNNFEKALHQLAAAGPAGQKAILAVGTEAGPALRALLNHWGMGVGRKAKGKLDKAAGSAAATAKVMQDNPRRSHAGSG